MDPEIQIPIQQIQHKGCPNIQSDLKRLKMDLEAEIPIQEFRHKGCPNIQNDLKRLKQHTQIWKHQSTNVDTRGAQAYKTISED